MLMDPKSDTAMSWPTHGRFFQSADRSQLFCVEMKTPNTPDQHVVRLSKNGSQEKLGPAISGFHTSQPLAIGDDQLCFWKGDRVWIFDTRDGALEPIAQTELGKSAWANAVRIADNRIAIFAYRNKSKSAPAACKMVLVERAG